MKGKCLTVFIILIAFVPLYSDEIENLIDQKKVEVNEWAQVDGDLPLVYLTGDKRGVAVYSESMLQPGTPMLCEPLQLDELIEMSSGKLTDDETRLNTRLPRVQKALERTCLIRPGDIMTAIGESGPIEVEVSEYVVRRTGPICPRVSPYTLYMTFSKPLNSNPLFFTTIVDLKMGSKAVYRAASKLPREKLGPSTRELLQNLVPFAAEYSTQVMVVDEKNCDSILFLQKRTISLDDQGLPSEVLISRRGDILEVLDLEKIDPEKGSGTLRLEGVLDYNQDGWIDLIVGGTQAKCPFKQLFEGFEGGFRPISVPNPPCQC